MSESDKNIIIGFIYTLGASETQANERGVMNSLNFTNGTQMERVGLQTTETLFVYNAPQFADVSKYFSKVTDPSHFKEFEEKVKLFKEEIPINNEKAFNMGARLAKQLL